MTERQSAEKAQGALLPRSPLVTGNDAQSTRGSPGDSDSYACEPSTFGFRPSDNHMAILIERGATVAVYRTVMMTGQRGAKGDGALTVPTYARRLRQPTRGGFTRCMIHYKIAVKPTDRIRGTAA